MKRVGYVRLRNTDRGVAYMTCESSRQQALNESARTRIAKVQKMTRAVEQKLALCDGSAHSADLGLGFQDCRGVPGEVERGAQPRNTGAEDEIAHGSGAMWRYDGLCKLALDLPRGEQQRWCRRHDLHEISEPPRARPSAVRSIAAVA